MCVCVIIIGSARAHTHTHTCLGEMERYALARGQAFLLQPLAPTQATMKSLEAKLETLASAMGVAPKQPYMKKTAQQAVSRNN